MRHYLSPSFFLLFFLLFVSVAIRVGYFSVGLFSVVGWVLFLVGTLLYGGWGVYMFVM